MLTEIFLLNLESKIRAATPAPNGARDPRFVPAALPRK
jgi:hypothetical protein